MRDNAVRRAKSLFYSKGAGRSNRKRYSSSLATDADKARLVTLLSVVEKTDEAGAYDIRNKALFAALGIATNIGYEAGVRLDPEEPKWPVIFIELPTGQISWHVPQHKREWDGHTNEEKYERIHDYSNKVFKRPAK